MSAKKPVKKKAKRAATKSSKKASAKKSAAKAKKAPAKKVAPKKTASSKKKAAAAKSKPAKKTKAKVEKTAKKAKAVKSAKKTAKKLSKAASSSDTKKLSKAASSSDTKKPASSAKTKKAPTAAATEKKPLSPKTTQTRSVPAAAKPAAKTPAKASKAKAKAKPKQSKPRKPGELPPLIELEDLPTEDLWGIYHDAVQKPEENKVYIQGLRNLLIERHYPLVRYIAERLLQTLPKSIELDDLISAGLFGLMDAIRGFDAGRGIKFKTYCSTRIRGSILDQLRSQDWVPRLVRLKAGKIERALQKLTGEYGREPTHAELARNLEMQHDDLVKEIQESRAKTMFSLSEKWEDDDGSVEKVEILEDKYAIDPVSELNRRDLMGYITRSLTHKERFIIEQYYQFGHTMREIGEMLALTESRVCQIHSNVMGRLKGLLGVREDSLLP